MKGALIRFVEVEWNFQGGKEGCLRTQWHEDAGVAMTLDARIAVGGGGKEPRHIKMGTKLGIAGLACFGAALPLITEELVFGDAPRISRLSTFAVT